MTRGADRSDDAPRPAHAGDCIADRYHLTKMLGRGSFGQVWEAHDAVTRQPVAVKLLHPHIELASAQAEVAALRLRLPGVVELKDNGIDRGRAFLVMELVDGRPFPARKGPCSWDDISGVTGALLEALGRVHQAFIVHRDLKPENVLVAPGGRVCLLDFSVAYRQASGSADRALDAGHLLGTSFYMAPEQIQAGTIDERTDLYALGVMLYSALAGRMPHDERDPRRVLFLKMSGPAPPLREVAPHVPEPIARLVDRMLAIRAEDRPRTAFDVLAELRGEGSIEDPLFPWIGPQTTLGAVLSAAREGLSVDIVGRRGTGRTRHLLAVAQQLSEAKEKKSIVWVRPAEGVLESLAGFPGARQESASLEDALLLAEQRVRAALAAGTIFLVDDASRIDRWSAEVLARVRGAGVVIRALEDADGGGARTVRLRPLTEAELRSVFAGPDRLLHLREDAARVLFQSTEGVQARVIRELSTWMDLGIARRVWNLVAVSRSGLDRLDLWLPTVAPADADAAAVRDLSVEETDLLVWAALAWPHTSAALLSEVTGAGRDRVEALVAVLSERGLARTLPDGRVVPQIRPHVASWSEERVRGAHAALARSLAPGSRGRLFHLVTAGAKDDAERRTIAREAAALAASLIDEGHLGHAVAAIETGLRFARAIDEGEHDDVEELLSLWVEAAFEELTPHALDPVLYALCRTKPRTEGIARLEHLVRALSVEELRGRALAILSDMAPFRRARIERVRLGAFAIAVRKVADDRMESRLLHEGARSPSSSDPETVARLDHGMARILYLRGKFGEAARRHVAAAERSASVPMRISAMISAAYSLLEAYEPGAARALAEQARELAARHRHASHEVMAEWTLRTIAYREGNVSTVDAELVQAVSHAAGRNAQGLVLFTEAVIAWRAGRTSEASNLARRGQRTLSEIQSWRGATLLRALLCALGEELDAAEIDELCERARASPVPGIGIQVLALLASGGRLPPGAIDDAGIQRLAELVPREHWTARGDILSVEECLERIRAARARAPSAS